jgi:hypothetical protein
MQNGGGTESDPGMLSLWGFLTFSLPVMWDVTWPLSTSKPSRTVTEMKTAKDLWPPLPLDHGGFWSLERSCVPLV